MNYKPDEQTLMSYLYGELSDKEKEKVEQYFREHPEERAELKALSDARDIISSLDDKEVIAPPVLMDERPVRSLWETSYFRFSASMAATLLLVMVAARLLGTEVSYSDGEFRITMGKRHEVSPAGLTADVVQGMINTSLERNNEAMTTNIAEQQRKLDESIRQRMDMTSRKMNDLLKTTALASEEQVRAFVGGLQDDNLRLMKDYLQLSNQEQRKYVESLLVDFSKYLQEQRNQDLNLFQTRMNSMESNSNQFKQETEQILSSIISQSVVKKNSY